MFQLFHAIVKLLCLYHTFSKASFMPIFLLLLALEKHQDDFCNCDSLPEVRNFVGRDQEIKECLQALGSDSNEKFVIITGGPCYGKSSLAMKLGFEMYERDCNYVVWINMRDITRNPDNPTLGDMSLYILQQFNIDTSNMKDDIEACLERKLKIIADSGKTALLIFDNADNLIHPVKDESCQSSEFEKLCQLIRGTSKQLIRAIFTSRVCKSSLKGEHRQVKLGYLSDIDSRLFLSREFQDKSLAKKDSLIDDLVGICHGLPYALKLISSEVIEMDHEEIVREYVEALKKNPVDALDDDDSRLTHLFDLSYKCLKEKEKKAFTSLAVFPSGFSYAYLSKFWNDLDGVNTVWKLVQTLKKHSLLEVHKDSYSIHPFLRDFLQTKWDDDSRVNYEITYYKTYIEQLFALARKSLEKDEYAKCLSEFQQEQQNFVYVMALVERGSESCPSYLRTIVEKLLSRPTPDYISVLLFYCHELYLVDATGFFKGCETFVERQKKKCIWCCRFDVSMAKYEKEIDNDYSDIEPDEYGKVLVEKRKLSFTKRKFSKESMIQEFKKAMSRLDRFRQWAEQLSDYTMKNYFTHKILKIKVRLSKRVFECKELKIDDESLIRNFEEAVNICQKSFGEHGLTVDCYVQFGKLYWFLKDENKAKIWLDKALELAESMSAPDSKRYLSCLIDKGRLLVDSKNTDSIVEGRQLLEDVLKRCKDASDEVLWLLGMQSLMKVDGTKAYVILNHFLEEGKLLYEPLNAIHLAVSVVLDSPDNEVNSNSFVDNEKSTVKKLQQVIDHLEKLCNDNRDYEESLLRSARIKLYVWNMRVATTCMHALSQSGIKKCAQKALALLESWDFIAKDKKEELSFILNCDEHRYELMQKKCLFDQMAKRIPSMKNQLKDDYDNLLASCEKYQDVWSWTIRGLTRNDKRYFEKVIPYLLTQSEPDGNLLKLVLGKFIYQMEVYKREASQAMIDREKRAAVFEIRSAIEHVECLLAKESAEGSDTRQCLEGALKVWYTNLAIKSKGILSEEDRRYFALQALEMLVDNENTVTDRQKSTLQSIVS